MKRQIVEVVHISICTWVSCDGGGRMNLSVEVQPTYDERRRVREWGGRGEGGC